MPAVAASARWLAGLLLLAAAGTGFAALAVAARRASERAPAPPGKGTVRLAGATSPIPSEAGVFRTIGTALAIPPETGRLRDAHPRTLRRYRLLRAYPGAPPRIPHGFTADEFRTGECNTCHQRGGYAPRFGAYVPVTPHPEMPACLQCHVGNDAVTGVALPDRDPSTVCRQCHAPGAARWAETTLDWRPMPWPEPAPPVAAGEVPPIAHELFLRVNCLACHSGPAAVAEIRTTHPERRSCRQCHPAPDEDVGEYVRPPAPDAPGAEFR